MKTRSKVPLVIIGVLLVMLAALITLLVLSRTIYPTKSETQFMQSYQSLDKSFNALTADQQAFESSYRAEIITHLHSPEPIEIPHLRDGVQSFPHGFVIGKNRFEVVLTDAGAHAVSDANVSGFVSSFHTSDYDQTIALSYDAKRNCYVAEAFDITAAGRYKITVSVRTLDGKHGYVEKAVFAK
ncbi:hypothetical protein FACS1894103_4150 [Campylobacterota bacterium]|nr:hypothetical protein FACS1894103_4150 [Campylobacterota bacterium]